VAISGLPAAPFLAFFARKPALSEVEGWGFSPTPFQPSAKRSTELSPSHHPSKTFLDDLSNLARPFDYVVKAGQPPRQKEVSRVIRYVKNLQIACRFPATPFD
jgi:hypothetical protein